MKFNQGEINYLKSIANAEPILNGPAVYKARALLALIGENENKSLSYSPQNSSKSESPNYYLTPNPACNQVQIFSKNPSDDILELELYYPSGIKILNYKKLKTSAVIDISALASGIYFYKINANNSGIFTGKLIINSKK